MGCIYSIYFIETFTVAIMHQLAWNNNSLHKVTVMESDIHFISLCLGFVEQPHSLSSRVQRVLILSIAPFPINVTHFHVKAQRNRWIATGEKSSYLTGRLCTCFFFKNYATPSCLSLQTMWREIRYMNHEWCAGD